MSEIVNKLASQTGISSDLIEKGLGAFLSFLKKELGHESFTEVESSVPGAANTLKTFEESPEPAQGQAACWEWSASSPARSSAERRRGRRPAGDVVKTRVQARADRELSAQGPRVDQNVSLAGAHSEDPGGSAGTRRDARRWGKERSLTRTGTPGKRTRA